MRVETPQAPTTIECPNLTAEEQDRLQSCVNAVRAGEREFFVRLTNHKVTKSRKRIEGQDYDRKRALAPHAHEGWLIAAPTGKNGVYLHIYDEARAKDPNAYGHTRITMRGIQSFEVVTDPRTQEPITRPGPLGQPEAFPEPEAPRLEQGAPQGQPFGGGFDPRMLMAQAMFLQAQAMMTMAQALMAQAQAEFVAK